MENSSRGTTHRPPSPPAGAVPMPSGGGLSGCWSLRPPRCAPNPGTLRGVGLLPGRGQPCRANGVVARPPSTIGHLCRPGARGQRRAASSFLSGSTGIASRMFLPVLGTPVTCRGKQGYGARWLGGKEGPPGTWWPLGEGWPGPALTVRVRESEVRQKQWVAAGLLARIWSNSHSPGRPRHGVCRGSWLERPGCLR